ncbi:hypothetical protein [Zavarzinella formosa]|uniref:hypothetical protein n=1 Tax=Zavarzinella formosa TaxID=360055 RepID=UPI0002E98948|nr:hypothetical protein [Zavarzinella formosa]
MRFAFLILLLLCPPLIAAPALPPDNRATVEALREATELLESGKIETDEQVKLWCKVAELRGRIGDRRGVMDAIGRACEITDGIAANESKWRPVVLACVRLGEMVKALELAALLPEDGANPLCLRGRLLMEAAIKAADAGCLNAAEEMADAITDEDDEIMTRRHIGRLGIVAQFKSGDTEAALRAVTTLPAAIDKIYALVGFSTKQLTDDITEPGDGIADLQLLAGDKAGAKRSALAALALIPGLAPRQRHAAALGVIRILCQLDHITEARKVMARHLADKPDKWYLNEAVEALARGYVATAEVRAGRDEAALAVLKDFDQMEDHASLLRIIALAQARAGRKEASTINFARAIKCAASRKSTEFFRTSQIYNSQALAGDIDGAIQTARYFEDDHFMGDVIILRAKTGDFDGARKTLAAILDPPAWLGRDVLPEIARIQAAAGQPEAVRVWAAKLKDDHTKVAVFLGLAEGLCQSPGRPGGK